MKNGPARRQVFRLSRERRVADIMAAARDVFREKGYEDAPMSDIAVRANVVEGSIYRYFENKRDLLVKVIEDWYEAMLADYDQQLSGIRGTRNRLRFMIWRHLKTIHEEPALCDLMFQFLRTGRDYSHTTVYELNKQYTRRTLDIIKEGIAAGELRGDVALRLVRDMIYGCIEHHTWAYLRGEGQFDPDATADAIVDLVLSGLQVRRLPQTPDLADRLERAIDRLEGLAGKPAG
ncbi:TetR/AcrR family transcriptional regulator [Mesorhizobium australicum]|uniref:Transcriptional regulator, TetR family n=1 Tax=Mesorhizobium australicum TaxID=536018 RepID=A0A1X7PLS4_9HYPH|nr:TetR/AcrR family transcriptional regulator [Mesorhizobium australicum]SMH51796.1 transcriptional regulator, TetR family [Mesorhizobium australicum]